MMGRGNQTPVYGKIEMAANLITTFVLGASFWLASISDYPINRNSPFRLVGRPVGEEHPADRLQLDCVRICFPCGP